MLVNLAQNTRTKSIVLIKEYDANNVDQPGGLTYKIALPSEHAYLENIILNCERYWWTIEYDCC